MRILQLTSDWKWTGPAAPMIELLLAQRESGEEVELVCPPPPAGEHPSLVGRAREAGVERVLDLERARGVNWWRDKRDVERLSALIEERRFEVVHTWHTRDHVLAVRATARRRKAGATRIVRSHSSAETIGRWPWNAWLFGPSTDGLICVSPGVADRNERLRRGRPTAAIFSAVDLDRFAPASPEPALRAELGLEPHHRVVGVVSRVQRQRRFDLFLEAAARLAALNEDARLLVIGRGTNFDELLNQPALKLGIRERLVFAGYRGEDYADVLRCCDVFTLLVPGSDGGCRALLEAAACGLPAVTTSRGALPELVGHGEAGLVVEESAAALAEAWQNLLADPVRRARLGSCARQRAEELFNRERLARETRRIYEATFASPARPSHQVA